MTGVYANEGRKKNAPEIKLNKSDYRGKKEVKSTREESMVFIKDGKQKKKTWTITEYKDGRIGKTLKKIEVIQ